MMLLDRRQALIGAGLALAAAPASVAAQGLRPTPAQTEGPFYPDVMPPETDPDLVRVGARQAKGELLDLRGRVLGLDGRPIKDAMVEIWQCDVNGRYIHSDDARRGQNDPGFQGFARVKVDAQGNYAFRTIKPVPYPGRTPHIHYKVFRPDRRVLTTQMLIAGEPGNDRDIVFRSLSPAERGLSLAQFRPGKGGFAWATHFDVVLA